MRTLFPQLVLLLSVSPQSPGARRLRRAIFLAMYAQTMVALLANALATSTRVKSSCSRCSQSMRVTEMGRTLLSRVAENLWSLGFKRLFLGCSSDPSSGSYGFYRHLGWRPTRAFDAHADEVLELLW